MAERTVLRGRIVTPHAVIGDGALIFSDTIEAVGAAAEVFASHPDAESQATIVDGYILPGLVDVHCHGGAGESFPNAETAEQALTAVHEHRAHGTTSLVASTVTAEPGELRARAVTLTQLCRDGELAGIHFEGPFVSVARCGAQDPTYIIDPDPQLTNELLDICDGYCVTMTVAPEKPGAFGDGSVGDVLIDGGALPSWGHTDAGPNDVRAALRWSREKLAATPSPRSAQVTATHLFNGMRPIHHRDPGPIPEFIADAARDGAILELIADGVHVAPSMVRAVYETIGRDAIVFVTDAMAAAGMADGHYELGPQAVIVDHGVARLADGGSIAGGTSHLIDQVRLLVSEVDMPLVDVVYMASAQGARILGDDTIGSLAVGKRADVLVTSDSLHPQRVFRTGAEFVREA